MARKKAAWMKNLAPEPRSAVVYAVVPWREDGVYSLDHASRAYGSRGMAERQRSDIDVVREIDLYMDRDAVLRIFLATRTEAMTGLRVEADLGSGFAYVVTRDGSRFRVRPCAKRILCFELK